MSSRHVSCFFVAFPCTELESVGHNDTIVQPSYILGRDAHLVDLYREHSYAQSQSKH